MTFFCGVISKNCIELNFKSPFQDQGLKNIVLDIDHGRSDEPVNGENWEKIVHIEKLKNLSSVFQNGLAFLGQNGKARLSEFPEIYGLDKFVSKHLG